MKIFDIIFGKMIDRRIANYQNDLIQKQCEQIENIYRTAFSRFVTKIIHFMPKFALRVKNMLLFYRK